jgi:hypothetical protein
MKLSSFFIFLSLFSMLVAACLPRSAEPLPGTGQDLLDYEQFVQNLRDAGHTVEETGQIEADIFDLSARTLLVNGESIQVYQFSSVEAQQAAAATISANGHIIGTRSFFWISQPYFYAKDTLIVLSHTVEEDTIELLAAELGRPLTGAEGVELRP